MIFGATKRALAISATIFTFRIAILLLERILSAQSSALLFVLSSRPEALLSLDFSPDGNFLAASGTDGSVRVYLMPVEKLMTLARDRLTRE